MSLKAKHKAKKKAFMEFLSLQYDEWFHNSPGKLIAIEELSKLPPDLGITAAIVLSQLNEKGYLISVSEEVHKQLEEHLKDK
jgi:hypothetical protein